VRRLLTLALLGWGLWFLYTTWWPANNPQTFGGRLESALSQELTRSGVTDRDVISQVRKERAHWGLTWVETRRTVRVSSMEHAQELSRAVSRAAGRLGCSVDKSTRSDGVDVRVKRYLWVFQKLSFVTAPAASTAPMVTARAVRIRMSQAAFVIDDVAYETASMDRFAALGVPLTFAILPGDRHSAELARKAGRLHFPVMLHLPMEPKDRVHNDPGPSGLYLSMTEAELQSQFDNNVAGVPGLVGINNHMGSAFTENRPGMNLVMAWVKKRNLFFLDSHTTAGSVVCQAAAQARVPCLTNQTFLDNQDDVASIEKQLDRVMTLAVKHGRTIAIGHYRRKHLTEALANKLPEFKSRGIQVVALPSFYKR
jgi:polysaccharide deacetylase 2 family uncharacterized protein YibQ